LTATYHANRISQFHLVGRTMRNASILAAVMVAVPTLAAADSATVASGVKSQITTHARYDSQCQTIRPVIRILTAPTNGNVTVEPKDVVVSAESDRGIAQQPQCIGKTIDGVAIYYQSNPGFVGKDSFRYQRLNPKDAGDRFNAELGYTITVR
jgi:hypothetical protein